MKPTRILIAALLALVLCTPALAQQKATLNLVSAGDQNMVDYLKDYLAPMFEKEHPGVTVRAVGQFSEDFEPSGGLFAPGYPLPPVEPEQLRALDYPVGYNYIYTPRSFAGGAAVSSSTRSAPRRA